jgi:hypothetical protein
LPLYLNSLIPEGLSRSILKLLQPHRNTAGQEGKFEAYYRYCGAPSKALQNAYQSIGYEVVQHTSYVGHDYYKRIPILRNAEKVMRKVIVNAELPIISTNLLILRKPRAH